MEHMLGGEAIFVDVPETVVGDVMRQMSYSIDPKTKQEWEQELVKLLHQKKKKELVKLIQQKLTLTTQPSNYCIYRVPETLSKENQAAYAPQMISIGPFHHDNQQLHSMEPFKMYYFNEFLSRKSQPKLEDYINVVTNLGERAYQCYSGLNIDMKSFVMMMVVDGGFILGLLLKIMDDEYFSEDSNSKLSDFAFVDLILLENQLPFFILQPLYGVLIEDSQGPALREVIRSTLVPLIVGLLVGKDRIDSFKTIHGLQTYDEPKHLLDLVRQYLIPSSPIPWKRGPERASSGKISNHLKEYNLVEPMRCATELEKANVKFVENKNPENLLDIYFDTRKGVLTIPGMIIDRETEIVLRNLVIYEQYTDDYSYITDYAAFLDDLIISVNDAELLQKSGIIDTKFGDPGEVARIFDKFVKDVAVPCYYTNPIRRRLLRHCNKLWNEFQGAFFQTFVKNRSALLHNMGFLIVGMTVIQTIYVALTYYH